MMIRSIAVVSAVVTQLLLAAPAYPSDDSGGGAGAIAGLMQGGYDDYAFSSAGGVILFADLDAYIFQNSGRGMGHEAAVAADPTHGSGGGCAGDGPGGFCLQLLDSIGQLVCWADRPVSPGWMRDPSLACPLPASVGGPETYTLRVSLRGEGESPCSDTVNYPSPKNPDKRHPYLLHISIKNIAPTGSLMRALGISYGDR
jgi:hypothetical protein